MTQEADRGAVEVRDAITERAANALNMMRGARALHEHARTTEIRCLLCGSSWPVESENDEEDSDDWTSLHSRDCTAAKLMRSGLLKSREAQHELQQAKLKEATP